MASRPSKRQKRPIVLSSDDEQHPTFSASQSQSCKFNGGNLEWKDKLPDASTASSHVLPRRPRIKTRSTTVNPHPPTSGITSPTSPAKRGRQKRGQVPRAGSIDPLYTIFNNTHLTSRSKDRLAHEAQSLVAKVQEDFIEDDSFDEELRKLPDSQSETTFPLDRRKTHPVTAQTRTNSTYPETVISASQKFIFPTKVLQPPRSKTDLAAAIKADIRPWAERYGPRGVEELAVHKKKVVDVRGWLEKFKQGQDHKVWIVIFPYKLHMLK